MPALEFGCVCSLAALGQYGGERLKQAVFQIAPRENPVLSGVLELFARSVEWPNHRDRARAPAAARDG
jgi:hypothetical protein